LKKTNKWWDYSLKYWILKIQKKLCVSSYNFYLQRVSRPPKDGQCDGQISSYYYSKKSFIYFYIFFSVKEERKKKQKKIFRWSSSIYFYVNGNKRTKEEEIVDEERQKCWIFFGDIEIFSLNCFWSLDELSVCLTDCPYYAFFTFNPK